MRQKIGFLAILLTGLLLFLSCSGLRINTEIERVGINFGDRDSILRLEQDPALFRLWAKWNPIEFLMTREEKKLAKKIFKLQDDVERNAKIGAFIKWFWERRDDNAYDNINEFKENFYNRVVEAQTRFARDEDAEYFRRCAYGKGWQTDLGMIYIALGEPFDRARYDVRDLMNFLGGYQDSILIPQDIEIWYYETPEDFMSSLFGDQVAWIIFEKDASGYWRFGETTFSLFFSYESYYDISSYFRSSSMTYSYYISEVYRLIGAVAETYIYDEDSEFEDIN